MGEEKEEEEEEESSERSTDVNNVEKWDEERFGEKEGFGGVKLWKLRKSAKELWSAFLRKQLIILWYSVEICVVQEHTNGLDTPAASYALHQSHSHMHSDRLTADITH